MKFEEKLEKLIIEILKAESKEDEDLLGEPDLSKEDEREKEDSEEAHHDEQSVAAGIAGYTLPLGASNHPTSLKQRGETTGKYFGGAQPVKKKKKAKD
ncbi:hypothetical protein CL634_00105 [bacterium]|nr:hypothetical protein [bacterium]